MSPLGQVGQYRQGVSEPRRPGYDLTSVTLVRVSDPSSSATFEFDLATALEVSDVRAGSTVYKGRVHPGWDIMGNANGGYILALVGHALARATGRPDCLTVTAHYLAPCPAADITIEVAPVRSGRRFSTAMATMIAIIEGQEKKILQVVATMADLASDPGGPTAMLHAQPPISPFESCISLGATSINDFAHLHGRLGTRGELDDVGFRNGHPTGAGLMRGWFCFNDGRPVDTRALLLASDAFPPAVFNLDVGSNWVPTVELTVHTRSIPAPGPVACYFATRYLQNGLLEEDGEIWDSAGVLVAQSRQLALAPRP